MTKIKYYGINGGIYSLIELYLENRYQSLKYNNKLSNWGKINKGVPQGSILGPLLFFIYINDLPSFIQRFGPSDASVVLFADDISVTVHELNYIELESKLKILLKLMNGWFNSNILSLNLDKTCCMTFQLNKILSTN
jgi:hypothetical protein